MKTKYSTKLSVTLSLVALNLVIGSLVSFAKLPIYLDSIGIVISTLLIGWQFGIICALLTIGIGFFLINPYLPAYTCTSIGIVLSVAILRRLNGFSSYIKVIICGFIIAVVSATLSAPVTAFLFEGSTLSGNDAITALFLHVGHSIWRSVFLSGLSSEPFDKILVCLISFQILKAIPKTFIDRYGFKNFRNAKKES